jgi:hypothetical protein
MLGADRAIAPGDSHLVSPNFGRILLAALLKKHALV